MCSCAQMHPQHSQGWELLLPRGLLRAQALNNLLGAQPPMPGLSRRPVLKTMGAGPSLWVHMDWG